MLRTIQVAWDVLTASWWIPALWTVFLILIGKLTVRDIAGGNRWHPRSKGPKRPDQNEA